MYWFTSPGKPVGEQGISKDWAWGPCLALSAHCPLWVMASLPSSLTFWRLSSCQLTHLPLAPLLCPGVEWAIQSVRLSWIAPRDYMKGERGCSPEELLLDGRGSTNLSANNSHGQVEQEAR